MIPGFVQRTAARAARGLAFSLGALLALLVGLGFLTTAAFVALATAKGVVFAALMVALAYFGLALILIALAAARPADSRPMAKPLRAMSGAEDAAADDDLPPAPLPPLMQAFIFGLSTGAKAGRRR